MQFFDVDDHDGDVSTSLDDWWARYRALPDHETCPALKDQCALDALLDEHGPLIIAEAAL